MGFQKTRAGWLAGVMLAMVAGCSDPMLENVGPGTVVSAPRPMRRGGAANVRSAPVSDASGGDVYLLYLLSADAEASGSVAQGPYTQVVKLENAAPAKAMQLMAWLTEPSGRGGSRQRSFLVYTDPTVQEWAGKVVAMLDVPADEGSDWAKVVGRLLEVAGPRFADPVVAEKIVQQLEPLCLGQTNTGYRWPACMLAGRLLDEQLGRSREAAGRFEQAAAISLKTSPAWLMARYAQARALQSAGDRAAAKAVAADIVQNARAFQRTTPYREAQKIVQGK